MDSTHLVELSMESDYYLYMSVYFISSCVYIVSQFEPEKPSTCAISWTLLSTAVVLRSIV